jgi:hypothetical protein
MWRNVVCGALSILLPMSVVADDTGAAMLRTDGTTRVNDKNAPTASAIYPNDLIRTPKAVGARIEAVGSLADINPESQVQFEGDELVLDHGSVSVSTSRVLKVRVGCIRVTPVNADWTNYAVTDTDGKITVSALKSDVYIDERSGNPQQAKARRSERQIVHEGEQQSRTEKCGAGDMNSSEHLAGIGPALNSLSAKIAGFVAIGLTCLAICHDDDPTSPSGP